MQESHVENHVGAFTEEKQVQLHKGMVSLFKSEILQASYQCKFKRDPKAMIAELKGDIEEDDKGAQRLMEPSKWNIPKKDPFGKSRFTDLCVVDRSVVGCLADWVASVGGMRLAWWKELVVLVAVVAVVVGGMRRGAGGGGGATHLHRFLVRKLHV